MRNFRYEGTTCRNMGRPILFDYTVKLGPREEGYPIREQAVRARARRRRPHLHVPLHEQRRAS